MYRELNPASQARDRAQRLRHRLPRSRAGGDPALARTRLRPRPHLAATARPWSRCRSPSPPSPSAASKTRSTCPTPTAASPGTRASSSPACAPGEHLESRDRTGAAGADPRRRRLAAGRRPGRANANTRSAAPRSTSPAKSAKPAKKTSPTLARQGFAADTPVGISGLERAFNTRLAGKPGGSLLAVDESGGSARVARRGQAAAGRAGEDDDRPRPAGSGRRRPRRPRRRHRRARRPQRRRPRPRRPGLLGPPAAGLDLQDDHHRPPPCKKGVVSLDDEFEITNGVNVGGRFINNANGEYCGGTFRQAFAESCNADFAPLGPKIGNDELVATAERFGFNSPPTLYAPKLVARSRTARIDDPDRNRRRNRPRRLRDRPGRSAGDAAGDGERGADDRQRRRPRADLDRRQQEAAPARRSRCG